MWAEGEMSTSPKASTVFWMMCVLWIVMVCKGLGERGRSAPVAGIVGRSSSETVHTVTVSESRMMLICFGLPSSFARISTLHLYMPSSCTINIHLFFHHHQRGHHPWSTHKRQENLHREAWIQCQSPIGHSHSPRLHSDREQLAGLEQAVVEIQMLLVACHCLLLGLLAGENMYPPPPLFTAPTR